MKFTAKFYKIVGVLLAFPIPFGSFGVHQSFLGNYRLAFVYALFFWTGIPGIISFIEMFWMPQRIQDKFRNDFSLEWKKFIVAPLSGFALYFIILTGFSRYLIQPYVIEKFEEIDKWSDIQELEESKDVSSKTGQEVVAEMISEESWDEHYKNKLIKTISLLFDDPKEFYSRYVGNTLKSKITEKRIKEISNLLNDTNLSKKIFIQMGPQGAKIDNEYIDKRFNLGWIVNKNNESYELRLYFFDYGEKFKLKAIKFGDEDWQPNLEKFIKY